jgi:F0F1-type ATP synthase membrane subunit a
MIYFFLHSFNLNLFHTINDVRFFLFEYFWWFKDKKTKKMINRKKKKHWTSPRLLSNYIIWCYYRYNFVVVIVVVVVVMFFFIVFRKKVQSCESSKISSEKKIERIRCVAKEEKKNYEQKKIKPFIVCIYVCMCVCVLKK